MSQRALFKIGCEVFVRQGNRLLLGKRKNVTGAGTWALPGGHLEYAERLVDAACRELKEELDADVKPTDLQLISIVDGTPTLDNDNHYIHATFELRVSSFEPKLMEPDACEEWRYFELEALPHDNLFVGHKDIIENYLQKRLYKY